MFDDINDWAGIRDELSPSQPLSPPPSRVVDYLLPPVAPTLPGVALPATCPARLGVFGAPNVDIRPPAPSPLPARDLEGVLGRCGTAVILRSINSLGSRGVGTCWLGCNDVRMDLFRAEEVGGTGAAVPLVRPLVRGRMEEPAIAIRLKARSAAIVGSTFAKSSVFSFSKLAASFPSPKGSFPSSISANAFSLSSTVCRGGIRAWSTDIPLNLERARFGSCWRDKRDEREKNGEVWDAEE